MTATETLPFEYRRTSPLWRFWRDRFQQTAPSQERLPDAIQPHIRGAVSAGALTIFRGGDGDWWQRVEAGYWWDGATWVPTTGCTVEPTRDHDLWYEHVRSLSEAWGVSRAAVRSISDAFFKIKLREQRSWARRIYPWGVRRVGGAWNEAGILIRRIRDWMQK